MCFSLAHFHMPPPTSLIFCVTWHSIRGIVPTTDQEQAPTKIDDG